MQYPEHASAEERKAEDKKYVEGEGRSRMIRTSVANTPEIKKWVDKAREEIKPEKHWYTHIEEWWKGDREYEGSGWAHGARQNLAKSIGFTDGNIDNLFEAGIYSMLQSGEVDVSKSQRLIRMINEDSEFVEYEKEIAKKIVSNPKFGKEKFNLTDRKGVQLGGKRAKGKMLDQLSCKKTEKMKEKLFQRDLMKSPG